MNSILAVLPLSIWLYLCLAHGRFWQSGPQLSTAVPTEFPDVDIVVPARDEAATIGVVISSLCQQDYAGRYRILLVDDNSADATAACAGNAHQLEVITLQEKPPGWSGKLWALSHGIGAGTAPILLMTDADIVHDRGHLSALVAKLLESKTDMVSEMVRLNCVSLAERALIPAFVYFFQMLYPFARVNDPNSVVAAAAGGTVLIRRAALQRIGGIEAIKDSLIDDVALAKAVKAAGPIYLGHSVLATSIRPYAGFEDIWNMISRSAFTQLRHSTALLALTLLGLTLLWLVPVWEVFFASGWQFAMGLAAFALAALSYIPTLSRYGRRWWWALALPAIVLFYMAATLSSAWDGWRGRGARWKNRAYDIER